MNPPISLKIPRSSWRPFVLKPILSLPVISAELGNLITQLSTTIASLGGLHDTNELSAKASVLWTLFARLRLLGYDQMLVSDVESVIRTLEETTRSTEGRGVDSGYDSIGSSGERPARALGDPQLTLATGTNRQACQSLQSAQTG